MPSARIQKSTTAKMGRPNDGNDPKHLEMLRKLPCAVFGTTGKIHAHHLMRVDPASRGMGKKNDDKWAIPLSPHAHNMVHLDKRAIEMGEEAWLMSRGVRGRELAKALWACRGKDLEAYERVILRHAQDRIRLIGSHTGEAA